MMAYWSVEWVLGVAILIELFMGIGWAAEYVKAQVAAEDWWGK